MILVVGSVAAYSLFESRGLNFREPIDTDVICSYDTFKQIVKAFQKEIKACYPIDNGNKYVIKTPDSIIEAEIAWEGSTADTLLKTIKHEFDYDYIDPLAEFCWNMDKPSNIPVFYANMPLLYMLKMSHRFKKNSVHFKKTMDDILLFRKHFPNECVIPEASKDWFSLRERETYKNSLPKLNVSKTEFFGGDGIEYEFDHDSIHEAVKHLEKPAYTYFSDGEVWCDMQKFLELPEQIKLYAVLEESLVLAAERSQLPFRNNEVTPAPLWSFLYALEKVCTSITSGIFREYAWENYYKVIDIYREIGYDYMDRVHKGIETGIVKKLKE